MESRPNKECWLGCAPLVLALLSTPAAVFAQTDEIQVYDAEIADRGVYNLIMHTNFTPIGRKTPNLSVSRP